MKGGCHDVFRKEKLVAELSLRKEPSVTVLSSGEESSEPSVTVLSSVEESSVAVLSLRKVSSVTVFSSVEELILPFLARFQPH